MSREHREVSKSAVLALCAYQRATFTIKMTVALIWFAFISKMNFPRSLHHNAPMRVRINVLG